MPSILSVSNLEHAFAGSAGTVVAAFLLFPLERIKTLLQLTNSPDESLWSTALHVLQEDGPRGFYRGCAPMLQTVGVSQFLYFYLFEGLKEKLAVLVGSPDGVVGPYETLLASGLAGSLNMVVTEPLWRSCVVAQKARSDSASFGSRLDLKQEAVKAPPGVFGTVCRMWVTEGPRALWRGLGSSLWLVSNPVIQFFAYDSLKGLLVSRDANVSALQALVMGAIAKALATFATFPLQVAQSNLRATRERTGSDASSKPALNGMFPCLLHVFEERGLRGLYFGLWPKLLQTVTQAALMFAIYEKLHWLIRRVNRKGLRTTLQKAKAARLQ